MHVFCIFVFAPSQRNVACFTWKGALEIHSLLLLFSNEILEYSKVQKKTKNRNTSICLFVGCLRSQQHASVSQGRICSDNFTWCHTEIEAADQTFHLTQSKYTDTGSTSPSADPITPGAWQGSHWSANF